VTVSVGGGNHYVSTRSSVVVPVAFVRGMAVPVMEIVDVIVVGNADMSAAFAVSVVMAGVLRVALSGALVEMSLVSGVKMPVVDVVDMVVVGYGHMSTALTVNVGVVGVLEVGGGHECSSWECRMASLTI
jgi:hypothetical protein